MDESREVIDFLIITVLDAETRAILQKLPETKAVFGERGEEYFISTLPVRLADGSHTVYRIVVKSLRSAGNTTASLATSRAIQEWKPKYVILVGVAVGISPKIELGDILIADSVINFGTHKSLKSAPFLRTDTVRPSQTLLSTIEQYMIEDDSWRRLLQFPKLAKRKLGVHFGPVLSGDKLFMSESEFQKLKVDLPHILGADMEAWGVIEAGLAMQAQQTDVLIVRSISDYADRTKDDTWIGYAADIAASFVMGFITSGLLSPQKRQVKVTLSVKSKILDKPTEIRLISELARILNINADNISIDEASHEG